MEEGGRSLSCPWLEMGPLSASLVSRALGKGSWDPPVPEKQRGSQAESASLCLS